jgi:hypothetical protein
MFVVTGAYGPNYVNGRVNAACSTIYCETSLSPLIGSGLQPFPLLFNTRLRTAPESPIATAVNMSTRKG